MKFSSLASSGVIISAFLFVSDENFKKMMTFPHQRDFVPDLTNRILILHILWNYHDDVNNNGLKLDLVEPPQSSIFPGLWPCWQTQIQKYRFRFKATGPL